MAKRISAGNSQVVSIGAVGALRRALADALDERRILAQVVGEDGTAWNMCASFTPLVRDGSFAVLTLSHPQLLTMPKL